MIGDGRSAALVSRDGAIDWLCWPRFDSPALFASLLDRERGGEWSLRPTGPFASSHRYVDETNVVDTRFVTPHGAVRVLDAMVVADEEAKQRRPFAEHELLRIVEGLEGEVELELKFEPRPCFGLHAANARDHGKHGLEVNLGGTVALLRGDVAVRPMDTGGHGVRFVVRAGESRIFSLSFAGDAPAVLPPLGDRALDAMADTQRWWRRWAGRATYDGPYRSQVVRSALALKLMSYAPSGAIIAAPTTSLPERKGGALNWDYRFSWMRDAAYTVRALLDLGYRGEAEAFAGWMLHATRLSRPQIHVLYDVFGNQPHPERTLEHLSGYAGSSPVRTGNAASGQLQLDAYGEVIDALTELAREGDTFDGESQRMLTEFGEFVCRHWEQLDYSIWEPRIEPRAWTHSRALCWVALERLLELHEHGRLTRASIPVDLFIKNRRLIRERIEQHAWSPKLNSYIQSEGHEYMDASLLLMSWHGYHPPDHPRMRGTYECIVKRLRAGKHLLYRYEQSLAEGEGAFGICSFWEAEYLARGGGSLEDARRVFESLLQYANDVGLMAEEFEPHSGEQLGNFPQAFSHVGLIDAAVAIERREQRRDQWHEQQSASDTGGVQGRP